MVRAAAALLLATMRGSAFDWTHPHAWLYLDGNEGRWSFEMGGPNGLIHRGWKRTEVRKGDHVTVQGYRPKDGSNVANARAVTLPDGRKLFGSFQSTLGARSSGKVAPQGTPVS
jgi:hypothetical protein